MATLKEILVFQVKTLRFPMLISLYERVERRFPETHEEVASKQGEHYCLTREEQKKGRLSRRSGGSA